jgi:hypothetical protein
VAGQYKESATRTLLLLECREMADFRNLRKSCRATSSSDVGIGPDRELEKLVAGERAAIFLTCEQESPALLLIDEEKGRRAARDILG